MKAASVILLAVVILYVTEVHGGRNVVRGQDRCYETTWQCFGAHTSIPNRYRRRSHAPIAYVDGQDTTTISGHVSELEYVADTSGVEVRFMVLELEGKDAENKLRIVQTFSHVANKTGLIKIPLDLEVRQGSRIGFEIRGGRNPIRYRQGKYEGGHYTSFMGQPVNSDRRVFPKESVNRQYNFRICFDLARDEIKCPYTPAPIVDPCSPNPCKHMGECVADSRTQSGYTCNCRSGFQGGRCEIDVRECYETTWSCYGAHTSIPKNFGMVSRTPIVYVDGQETTTMSGHVSELEYIAEVTGVPVRFMIMELVRSANVVENDLRVVQSITHVAEKTGLIKVPLDWEVKVGSRIAFEVRGSHGRVPMKFRMGKLNGDSYKSFIGQPRNMGPNSYTLPSKSVNKQYAFRICFDLRRNEVNCPYV